MAEALQTLQKRLHAELDKFKAVEKDLQKSVSQRQTLEAQVTENTIVKEELDRLEDGATVYKMMGPVLVKQDLTESRANVQKRIDYITTESKRYDGNIKDLEKKQEKHKENLSKMQQQFQQAQVKAAASRA